MAFLSLLHWGLSIRKLALSPPSAHNARSNGRSLWSAVCDRMAKPFANRAEQAVSFIDLFVRAHDSKCPALG